MKKILMKIEKIPRKWKLRSLVNLDTAENVYEVVLSLPKTHILTNLTDMVTAFNSYFINSTN